MTGSTINVNISQHDKGHANDRAKSDPPRGEIGLYTVRGGPRSQLLAGLLSLDLPLLLRSTWMPGDRGWRRCSRTSSGSSCRCATTWRPAGRADDVIRARARRSPAPGPRDWLDLDTILARGYEGGTDLSGGQWQRVALARALCAVRTGAGVVLLDEPTAQLDVRGEAEIFDRILAATRQATTILISHRFSTVRHADRICVLEGGRVVELGTHDELMAARRALSHDVRPPGLAVRRRDAARKGRGGLRCPRSLTTCPLPCPRCGGP